MKKILSLLLAVVFAAGALLAAPIQLPGLVVSAAAEEIPSGDLIVNIPDGITPTDENTDENKFVFTLNEDGESYTVAANIRPIQPEEFVIPSTFKDKPVTAIGNGAFYFASGLKNVIIPDTVTKIGGSAFEFCESMVSVTIPESVTDIGKSAFAMCTRLRKVTIPSKIKVIEESTFNACYSLNEVTLPKGLERIETSAFILTGISSIDIPDSVTYIAFDAFLHTGLKNNKKYIDSGVFYLNKILMSSDFRDVPSSYRIKPGTTYINVGAFTNCHELTSITIPKSVKTIDRNAFDGCENLTMIFYEGTLEEFNAIDITNNEQYLTETVVMLESNIDKAPAKVSVKSVANVANGVQVTWNAVANADFYAVWRRGANTSDWALLGITDQTSVVDTSPTHRQYWRYSVQAINGAGESPFDYTGKYLKYVATPKLTGISNATNGIYFKWNAVSGASGYRVYRRSAGGNWQYITTVKGTSYTDTAVKNQSGKYYRYTVRAVVDGRYSGYEDFLYTKRLANPKLTSATSGNGGITVKWNAISGTTGYYVYRKTANSGWKHVGTCYGTKSTSFVDKTASKGTTYTYTVRAVYGKTLSYFDSGIKGKR